MSHSESIKVGIYQHYKGPRYEVIGIARHSETEEYLVVYRPLYDDRELWVRPLEMFTGMVVVDEKEQKRFAYIAETEG